MSDFTETVDSPSRICQQAPNTEPVPKAGTDAPCLVMPETCGTEIKRGGARPGAGRPAITSERPWQAEDISRRTYYRRLSPQQPTQISYATDTPRWYCVRTEYGAETAVDVAIRTAGFETLYPMLWVAPVAARRTELGRAIPAMSERLVPLLPRYLLVRFDRSDPSWRDICTMRGVERLFSTHPERPTAIPDSDVDALKRDLAPNMVLYPPVTTKSASVKKRWTDMATALASMQTETA